MNRLGFYQLITTLLIVSYGWIGYHQTQETPDFSTTVCPMKWISGIPCPACGTTRSMVHLMHGDLQSATITNPLGLISALLLLTIPFWLIHDLFRNKNTLWHTYQRLEQKQKKQNGYLSLLF